MKTTLNIALPKGRLGEKTYDMLEKAGIQEKDIVNVGGLEFEYIF